MTEKQDNRQQPEKVFKKRKNSDGLSLVEVFKILKLRRKLLYFFAITILAGSFVKHFLYVPTYTAKTNLLVQTVEQSNMRSALTNFAGAVGFEDNNRMYRYLNYIQSSEFFLSGAEVLKFSDNYERLKLTSTKNMSVFKKKFWRYFYLYRIKQFNLFSQFTKNKSSKMPGKAWNAPEIEPVLIPVERLAQNLASVIKAERTGKDSLTISSTTLDPYTSMVLSNTIAETFVKKTTERDYNEVSELKHFIEKQLGTTTTRLKKSELSLIQFKQKHNIISIATEQNSFSRRLTSIESQLETLNIETKMNNKLIAYYESMLAKKEKKLLRYGASGLRNSPSQVIEKLRNRLDSLQQKKVLMQASGYGETSPEMQGIDQEINQTAKMLKANLETSDGRVPASNEHYSVQTIREKLSGLIQQQKVGDSRASTLKKVQGDLLKQLNNLPTEEQELIKLTRDVKLQFELYSSLKRKLQEIQIQQVSLQSHLLISKRAGIPRAAPRTNIFMKILFSLLVGLFLGSITALIFETLDPTIKRQSELEDMELIPLGSIPHVETSGIRKKMGGNIFRPDMLICKTKPESPEAMAFKHIRAQLLHVRGHAGKSGKIITITSPTQGDGKTFVASNIAVSLAQMDKKTILLDCDFRYPSVPRLFGLKNSHGLTALLTLQSSLNDVIVNNSVKGLDILPAGWIPKNPTELISNDKFRVLLDYLENIYDYIIIDCPPAIAVVDAAMIASLSDAVILVTSFRKTHKHDVIMGMKKILQIAHKQLYTILNNVREFHEYNQYYYHYHTIPGHPGATLDESDHMRSELYEFEKSLKKKKAG